MANVTSSGNTTIKPTISAAKFMGASHAAGSSLENLIRINPINISSRSVWSINVFINANPNLEYP